MNYMASGSIKTGGCSAYSFAIARLSQFALSSIVYSIAQAKKGRYEKLCIKDLRFDESVLQPHTPLYIDTFNGFWNEDELCDRDTADDLIAAYNLVARAALEAQIRDNC